MTGLEAIRGKNEWWVANHTIHSSDIKGPFPNGERFSVIFNYVVSPKIGPMVGKKIRMEEVALYTVSDGKITREEFFYDMSGGGEVAESKPAKKKAKKAAAKKVAAKKAAPKKAAPKKVSKPAAKAKAKAKASAPKAGKKKAKGRR
jgi:hypothetical protein